MKSTSIFTNFKDFSKYIYYIKDQNILAQKKDLIRSKIVQKMI
jgi:hypothetical protein